MRKRNFIYYLDGILWFMIYTLPILVYAYLSQKNGAVDYSLIDVFSTIGISLNDSVIYSVFTDLFGSTGAVPLFAENAILMYSAYFVSVYFVHLAVDFLLLLPRLMHKLYEKVGD